MCFGNISLGEIQNGVCMFQIDFSLGGGKEWEGNIRVREKHRSVASCMCLGPGMEPTTKACALTGNQTQDPLIYRAMLQPSHTGQLTLCDQRNGRLEEEICIINCEQGLIFQG